MLVIMLILGLGVYGIYSGVKDKSGSGCLGVIVAVLLFILILLATAL